MELFFEIAGLLLLALIAFEVYTLKVALTRGPFALRAPEDKKELPTINVNVGTLPMQQAKEEVTKEAEAAIPPPAPLAAPPAPPPAAEPEPEPEPVYQAPPPPPLRAVSVNATASGLMALKCPSCQAENSSYRSECFNCGAALH